MTIVASVLIAAAAYTGYWLVVAAKLEARVAGWIDDRRAEGFRIDHGPISRSGFPNRLRLEMPTVNVTAPAGWAWRSAGLRLETSPLAPQALRLDLHGIQEVRLSPDQDSDGFTAEAARFGADFVGSGGVPIGTAVAEGLTLRPLGADETDDLRIGRVELLSTPGPAATPSSGLGGYRFSFGATDLVLPSAQSAPLGERIDRLSLLTEVSGDLALTPWPAAVVRWRDDGGTIEIRGLDVEYGPLRLTGDGTLALDRTGEPIGAFSLRANGLLKALRAMADKGIIPPAVAAGAAFVFRPPQGTGASDDASISLPASLQDGKLYLGPLPIARIPSPPWVPLPGNGS